MRSILRGQQPRDAQHFYAATHKPLVAERQHLTHVVDQRHLNLVDVHQHVKLAGMNLRSVNDIAALVRQTRSDQGWTQAHLAEQAGVSRDWIIALEKAKPSLELSLVLRTLKALKISLTLQNNQAPTPDIINLDEFLDNTSDSSHKP